MYDVASAFLKTASHADSNAKYITAVDVYIYEISFRRLFKS